MYIFNSFIFLYVLNNSICIQYFYMYSIILYVFNNFLESVTRMAAIMEQIEAASAIDALEEKENIEDETRMQSSSVLKKNRNPRFARRKNVHFPENILSVKYYDISVDDSDADTVILSDIETEERITGEVPLTKKRNQQVPQTKKKRRSKRIQKM